MRGVFCSIAVLALAATAAVAEPTKVVKDGHVMGTNVQVTFWTEDQAGVDKAFAAAMKELERLDKMMTTWTPDSEVSRINAAAGGKPVTVSDETLTVLLRALDISKRSKGLFDITVGVFQGVWKFDQNMTGEIADPAEVKKRLALVGWKDLIVDKKKKTVKLRRKGQAITLGGIAKGYAVDRAAALIKEAGYTNFIIQVGGDLYVSGKKTTGPWVVGIQDPRGDRGTMFAVAPIENHAFSTSGDYERGFVKDKVRYHHILDPRTGNPANKSRSVTVFAKDAFTADAWSKVLFIMGAKAAMPLVEKLPDLDAVFVDDKNEVHVSSGLKDVVKIQKQPTDGI